MAPEGLWVFDALILCYATYFKVSHLSEPGLPQSSPKQSTKKQSSLIESQHRGTGTTLYLIFLLVIQVKIILSEEPQFLIVFHVFLWFRLASCYI